MAVILSGAAGRFLSSWYTGTSGRAVEARILRPGWRPGESLFNSPPGNAPFEERAFDCIPLPPTTRERKKHAGLRSG